MHRHATLATLISLTATLAACAPTSEEGTPGAGDNDAKTGNVDGALKECATNGTVEGVDVSYYQGNIDWKAARAAGIAFGFARTSDGTGFKDPKFAQNWAGMKAAGVVRGTYQFFRPAQDPIAQANIMLQMLTDAGGLEEGDLAPTIDIEVTDGISGSTILSRAKTWIDHVQAKTGKKPLVYTAPGFWASFGSPTGFDTTSDLWVANWGVSCPSLPGSWSHWHLWQWSDSGSVPGINGAVDRDRWNGTLDELIAYAGGKSGGGGDPSGGGGVGAQPLGGSTQSAPALAPNADGRLEVFSIGPSSDMVTTFQVKPNAGWSAWVPLGGKFIGTPAAGVNLDGRIELFGRGADGAIWHGWQDSPNGKIGGFVSLGGSIAGDPVVAANQDGRLEAFAVATDGAIWTIWQEQASGAWAADWVSLGVPAGTDLADPRVITRRDGRMAIVARGGNDGAVYFAEQTAPNSGWTAWKSVGGSTEGAPNLANNLDGRLELFARGTDGALWHAWEGAASSFSAWESLGGGIFDPVATNDLDGRIEVFVRGTDGALYRMAQKAPNAGWGEWVSIGGNTTGAPVVGSNQDGRLEVFGRSADGSVVHSWQVQPGAWWRRDASVKAPDAALALPLLPPRGTGKSMRLRRLALSFAFALSACSTPTIVPTATAAAGAPPPKAPVKVAGPAPSTSSAAASFQRSFDSKRLVPVPLLVWPPEQVGGGSVWKSPTACVPFGAYKDRIACGICAPHAVTVAVLDAATGNARWALRIDGIKDDARCLFTDDGKVVVTHQIESAASGFEPRELIAIDSKDGSLVGAYSLRGNQVRVSRRGVLFLQQDYEKPSQIFLFDWHGSGRMLAEHKPDDRAWIDLRAEDPWVIYRSQGRADAFIEDHFRWDGTLVASAVAHGGPPRCKGFSTYAEQNGKMYCVDQKGDRILYRLEEGGPVIEHVGAQGLLLDDGDIIRAHAGYVARHKPVRIDSDAVKKVK